jgi:hypothetical protein
MKYEDNGIIWFLYMMPENCEFEMNWEKSEDGFYHCNICKNVLMVGGFTIKDAQDTSPICFGCYFKSLQKGYNQGKSEGIKIGIEKAIGFLKDLGFSTECYMLDSLLAETNNHNGSISPMSRTKGDDSGLCQKENEARK